MLTLLLLNTNVNEPDSLSCPFNRLLLVYIANKRRKFNNYCITSISTKFTVNKNE